MAQSTHNAGKATPPKETVVESAVSLTLDKVTVRERTILVDIPEIRYVPVEYEKPIVHEKVVETTRYSTLEANTVKYVVKEQDTTKYNIREIECEKPVIKEVVYEKPVIKEQIYEKPVIETKKMVIIEVQHLNELLEFSKLVKSLKVELDGLMNQIKEIKNYRLVEQVITVPKLEWTIVKAERIEWIPVKREMVDAHKH